MTIHPTGAGLTTRKEAASPTGHRRPPSLPLRLLVAPLADLWIAGMAGLVFAAAAFEVASYPIRRVASKAGRHLLAAFPVTLTAAGLFLPGAVEAGTLGGIGGGGAPDMAERMFFLALAKMVGVALGAGLAIALWEVRHSRRIQRSAPPGVVEPSCPWPRETSDEGAHAR